MANSCLDVSLVPGSILSRKIYRRSKFEDKSGWILGLTITLASIFIAIVFAPETPHQLASICERHNSELACRVW